MLQTAISALIVAGCAGYATWALMPKAWRRSLARQVLGREPAPQPGCGGCGGCDSSAPSAADLPPGTSVIRLHRGATNPGRKPG